MKLPFEYDAVPGCTALPTSADVQPDGSVGVVLDTAMFDTVAVASDVVARLVTTIPTYAVEGSASVCVATVVHCEPSIETLRSPARCASGAALQRCHLFAFA